MNSFTLRAVGTLARNPEAVTSENVTVARFCLIGHDHIGNDGRWMPREITTSIWFLAFDDIAVSVLQNARKGDQLIVEARPNAEYKINQDGSRYQEVDFIVTGFKYGATKGGGFSGAGSISGRPPATPPEGKATKAVA